MTKCCVSDCEAAGTVSANHPNADRYCPTHGVCRGCGESVAYFIHVDDLDIWICPCVALRRHEVVETKRYEPGTPPKQEEKKVIQFGDIQARKNRKRPTG